MGCCGNDREKGRPVSEEQKWDYITLSDFRSKSCIEPFSYGWLFMLVLITIAVYVADTFTAVNLIAFNRWSSQVKPAIPFEISKYIFFVCICLSWALCGLEWLRAIRVMRRGGVADSYLDPLAAILQSARWGKGQGWRRFLVFTELTRGKKGTDYIALFVYFQFKGAIRILLAEGPRQVVNGITLYSVMKADLIPEGQHRATNNRSPIQQFFFNIELLANSNREQIVILSAMLFTLVIWVFAALCLFIASILYLLFLWHYIPSNFGSLASYCRHKVDTRLEQIVSRKVTKAIRKQNAERRRDEQKFATKNGEKPLGLQQQPTLPTFGDDDSKSVTSSLTRQDSYATLPPYTSQGPTRSNTMTTNTSSLSRQPTMPDLSADPRRPFPPTRSATQSSNASYASNAPLLSDASPMGYGEPGRVHSPAPPLPPLNTGDAYRGGPFNRPTTPGSATSSERPYSPMSRLGNGPGRNSPMGVRPNGFGPPGLARQNSGYSNDGRNSPGPMGPPGAMQRQNTYGSASGRSNLGPSPLSSGPGFSQFDRRGPSAPGPAYEMDAVELPGSRPSPSYGNDMTASPVTADDYDPYRPSTPEVSAPKRVMSPQGMPVARPGLPSQPRPLPSAVLQSALQRREASNPLPTRSGASSVPPQQMQRSVTAPMGSPGYPQSQSPVHRAATAGPRGNGWNAPPRSEDGW